MYELSEIPPAIIFWYDHVRALLTAGLVRNTERKKVREYAWS